jgi:zinc/manganese transport system substrate-binding protein
MLNRRNLIVTMTLAPIVPAQAQQGAKVDVLASFSIVADLVRQVGGERVNVRSIVALSQDPHDFEPTPNDVRRVMKAQLIVINGLGFEPWADRFLKVANFAGERLVASRGVKALSVRGAVDPHAWQDVENVKLYIANIREALTKVDPRGASDYARNASLYDRELDALHREIKAALASIPKERRKIITSHDAFSYFGDAYDVVFVAPQGVSSIAEPSARDVARIIQQIREERIRAIFLENALPQRLAHQISSETGVKIAGKLYADVLGENIRTYAQMMRHNYKAILTALR